MSKQKVVILAFDIERGGGRACDDTMAIGVSVVDEDGSELGSLCLKGYFPNLTVFETRTWEEFWVKNKEMLETLKHDDFLFEGDLGMSDAEKYKLWPKRAIQKFHGFRRMWETRAKEKGWKLETVSDNKIYDGGFINDLYADHMVLDGTKVMPLPYSASDEPPAYKNFRETHSEQRGLLMAVDPAFNKGSFSKRVEELYDCSEIKNVHDHDHNPAHDAYSIAREAVILNGIRDRRIPLRKTRVAYYAEHGIAMEPWKERFIADVCGDGNETFTGEEMKARILTTLNNMLVSAGDVQGAAWAQSVSEHLDYVEAKRQKVKDAKDDIVQFEHNGNDVVTTEGLADRAKQLLNQPHVQEMLKNL